MRGSRMALSAQVLPGVLELGADMAFEFRNA